MMSFEDELQNLLNQHPEVAEVKVKYKRGAIFKPKERMDRISYSTVSTQAISSSTEAQMAAEMIKRGEL